MSSKFLEEEKLINYGGLLVDKQFAREQLWIKKYALFIKEHPNMLPSRERMIVFLDENNIPPENQFYDFMMEIADKHYGEENDIN